MEQREITRSQYAIINVGRGCP